MTQKITRKVILGDGEYQREEEVELREVNYGQKDMRWHLGDTEFDGHHTLWGFEYFPTTYMKESELSGNEYRKGGEVRFFRDRKQCFSTFCREPQHAARIVIEFLPKLMDLDWEKIKEGTKLYWRDTPAIITRVISEQGALIVKVDGAERFPDSVWAKEEWEKLEDPKEVKIDLFDPHIWWFRK